MIEQNAQVVSCQGDRMWVRLGPQSGCSACDRGEGCGAGLFARLLKRKPLLLELSRENTDVQPGQMLTLGLPERIFVKLVLLSYGWPLLAALAGAFAGHGFGRWLGFGPGLVDMLSLFAGLSSGAAVIHLFKNRGNEEALARILQSPVYFHPAVPNICTSDEPQRLQ